ncbi:MAG: hypothetical protein JSU69_07990 [Candidatus Zixiibacteriota bacterium]|nr:MAG: hypothetical protein JSU69_07990 [candidate division Zixibacteria bacterium]
MRTKLSLCITICLAAALMAGSSQAQIIYGQPVGGDVHLVYSHWKIEDDTSSLEINQLTVPLSGFIPLSDNFEARFYVANSMNNLSMLDSDSSLSGLSDFRIMLSRSFSDDRFLLSGGVNLPLGKKELNHDEEMAIIEQLSKNYLSFPMRSFGEGFGFNALFGWATMIGSVRCGAGAMYQFNGSYTPYEDAEDYDPGDFIGVNGNADFTLGEAMIVSSVMYTYYLGDKLGGDKIFKQSPQVDFRLGAVLAKPAYDLSGNLRFLLRDRHTRYEATTGAISSRLKMYGNEFSINGILSYKFAEKWRIAPMLEARLIGGFEEEDRNVDGASIFGFGGIVGTKIGRQLDFNVGARYSIGSANGGDIDLSGFQITSGLSAAF